MEPSTRDRSTIAVILARVGERLRAIDGLMAPDGASGLRPAVAAAVSAIDDALAIVVDPREARRVACPTCAYRVMQDATLCLSCWRKLDPTGTNVAT